MAVDVDDGFPEGPVDEFLELLDRTADSVLADLRPREQALTFEDDDFEDNFLDAKASEVRQPTTGPTFPHPTTKPSLFHCTFLLL